MRDLNQLREHAFRKTKEKLKKTLVRRDNVIVQTVKVIDLLDKSVNLMTEELKEWYALYFPELSRLVQENDSYVYLVAELKSREDFTQENIEAILGKKEIVSKIVRAARETVGGNLKDDDVKEISKFANDIKNLKARRRNIENYLEGVMKEEAKNISTIIGPVIGARLIVTAGSLERLAGMPSSTIQVLGAEKALFAHIRKGTPSPKYGVIFQFPKLRGAPLKIRGKIARKLAAKVSIAARLDYFGGAFNGEAMRRELDVLIDRLLEKYR